jgi:phosphatidylinositol glycan class B
LTIAAKYRPFRAAFRRAELGVPSNSKILSSSRERPWVFTALLCLVLLAVALRLVPVLFVPSLDWDDEIFQAAEPAHRLVYGYGIVPWEFQLGARSWLLPGAIAGLMELSRLFGDGPAYYLPVIDVAFALLGTAPVVCCFLWARRWYGPIPALAAAAAVAMAPELVYFGARLLTEVAAAHILIIGCWLLDPGYPVTSRRRLFVAGLLFGLACLLRIHLAPAAAVIAIWSMWRDWRPRLWPLLSGALIAIAFGAMLDWATLGYPLASLGRSLLYNLVYGVGSEFGTWPWDYYLLAELSIWPPALVLAAVAVFGARRLPALLIAAAVIVAVHSAIPHKEYRFVYPAAVLLIVVAGIGVAQLVDWGARRLARRGLRAGFAAAASAALVLAYWGLTAAEVWTSGFAQLRQRGHDNLLAEAFAARLPALCGLGLYGTTPGFDWTVYGGYTYLHRPVPMYSPKDAADLAATAPAFDTLLYTAPPPAELGFVTIACFGKTCVARRAGGCAAQPMAAMPFPQGVAGLQPPAAEFDAVPPKLRENAPH